MTTKYNVIIDSISSVFGGWDSGFAVDVSIHREPVDGGSRDGFENVRVGLDRDRLVKADGSYDMGAVTAMVVEKVGEVEEVECE
jgi:hypothetical protein